MQDGFARIVRKVRLLEKNGPKDHFGLAAPKTYFSLGIKGMGKSSPSNRDSNLAGWFRQDRAQGKITSKNGPKNHCGLAAPKAFFSLGMGGMAKSLPSSHEDGPLVGMSRYFRDPTLTWGGKDAGRIALARRPPTAAFIGRISVFPCCLGVLLTFWLWCFRPSACFLESCRFDI